LAERIFLWAGNAPFVAESNGQDAPSVYAYPTDGARGAMVVCPGGAYLNKSMEHEGHQIARMLNSFGIAAYVLDYRVYPCPLDAPLTDAKRAIRTVRALGYEKVGIMGFSAGGNLSCAAAVWGDEGDASAADPIERVSARPDVFVPCYGIASFRFMDGGMDDALRARADTLQNTFAFCRDIINHYDAEAHITEQTPPAFLWHTATDGLVPVQCTLTLALALSAHHVNYELHVYPMGEHGTGLATEQPIIAAWAKDCALFLLRRGFGR